LFENEKLRNIENRKNEQNKQQNQSTDGQPTINHL